MYLPGQNTHTHLPDTEHHSPVAIYNNPSVGLCQCMLNSLFTILNESVRGPKQWLKLIWDMNNATVADTVVRHTHILPYLSQIKVNCVYLQHKYSNLCSIKLVALYTVLNYES